VLSGYGLDEYDPDETGAVDIPDALKPYTTTLNRDQEGNSNDYITIEVQPELGSASGCEITQAATLPASTFGSDIYTFPFDTTLFDVR